MGLTWKLEPVKLLSNKDKAKSGAPRNYDALSYTWGKPDKGFAITCNDQTLKVRKSLYDALPYLSRRLQQAGSPPGAIWIDAVCINQMDEKETSEQIGRMADIYCFARQVFVWLGPGYGAHHNDAAIALLPLLTQVGEATFKYMMDSRQPEPDFSNMAMPDASSPVWKVLSDIIFHDWYTRLWVVQELALAQSAVALVGDSTLDFDTLENFIGFIISVFSGNIHNSGPGIEALRKEGAERNIDIARLSNTANFIILRGVLHEIPDTEPLQTSPLREASATRNAQRKGWRRRGAGLIDRYKTWRTVSAPTWFTEISNVLSPTSSVVTPIPSPVPQSSAPQSLDPLLNAVYMTTMSQQCTEAEDRVFGVLGFAEDRAGITALRLNDRRDKSQLAELYTVFMGYVFERGGHVIQDPGRRFLWDLFSFACLPKKTAGLPSWCPDLQVQRGPSTPYGLALLAERGFSASNANNALGFASHDYLYTADAGLMNMRRGCSQNEFVVKGIVFDCLKEVYPAFPEVRLHFGLDEIGHLKMHANIGQWEQDIASRVLGPLGDRAEGRGIVSLDTYWRTLVGNRTALSVGDSEFTCETLYALRDFHVRVTRLKTRLEELKER